MLPVLLDPKRVEIVLVGAGEPFLQRLALLEAAKAHRLTVYVDDPDAELAGRLGDCWRAGRPSTADLARADILFVAGLDEDEGQALADKARANGTLVNVEDVKPLCDFHVPSIVRRGDLLMTVSTGGKSPGLARRLRQELESRFGPEWADRLDELSARRDAWRAEGLALKEVGRRVVRYIDEKGWLS